MWCKVSNDVLRKGERCLKDILYQYLKTVKMCVLPGFRHWEGE